MSDGASRDLTTAGPAAALTARERRPLAASAAAGVTLAAIDESAGGATVAAQRGDSTTPARPKLGAGFADLAAVLASDVRADMQRGR
jgi:hypothetical protein